jgi:hypothetical protein
MQGTQPPVDCLFPPKKLNYFSKNDYVKKLKMWGVQKNVKKNHTTDTWNFIDKRLKKRAMAGKESDVSLHGKNYSRRRIQQEISRHVTYRDIYLRSASRFFPTHGIKAGH